jgi:hypothetical protein
VVYWDGGLEGVIELGYLVLQLLGKYEMKGTFSSLMRDCSSWRRMVRLSGVRFMSYVPELAIA